MSKNILKKLINKAFKEANLDEVKKSLDGYHECKCPDGSIFWSSHPGCDYEKICDKDTTKEKLPKGVINKIDKKLKKEAAKPDFIDIDGDGDKEESMKKAAKDKKKLKKEATVTADNTKFQLRTGVNKNPTKLGIKIQFEPQAGSLDSELKGKLEVALQEKLNTALADYDIQVSKDTDVPRDEVIGFFIPLSQLKNLIITSLTGKPSPKPTVPAPAPTAPRPTPRPTPTTSNKKDSIDEMINEALIEEMRVRDLNEASKIVIKEDFYNFINAGNNIIRTFEENDKTLEQAKKYMKYLLAHNIM
tara:strand:+ start:66 stop:974 length:909 start_codon:yes stop_codon:yes gene_type:complete